MNFSLPDNCCIPVVHSEKAPLHLAKPLYGYVVPIVIVITLVTNTFIVIVLSKKHLRTPSNLILLSMAICEALTGLISLPYMFYMYSMSGYKVELSQGLPAFWCEHGSLFIEQLPTMLHTATIWQTVYLAIQRYCYVCKDGFRKYCTMPVTRRCLIAIIIAAVLFDCPRYFSEYYISYKPDIGHDICCRYFSNWVYKIGLNATFSTTFWATAIFVHFAPCCLMIAFSGLLMKHITKADQNRRRTLRKTSSQRKMSMFMNSYQSSTRMLIVVIVVFLLVEIPAAVMYILHVLLATTDVLPQKLYAGMNVAFTVRNAMIMMSYPFNFAVYCCMSNQFRLTVSQLFTKERLFVEQQLPSMGTGRGFNRGTRYSVILVSTKNLKSVKECESCV